MLEEALKLMMTGAMRAMFDPIGGSLPVEIETSVLELWRGPKMPSGSLASSNPSSSGDDLDPSPSSSDTINSTSSSSTLIGELQPSDTGRWNLWRVVNSEFTECHCVEVITYGKLVGDALKILKQTPPSKYQPGTGYALFRDQISPRREDPALRKGGSFVHFHEIATKKSSSSQSSSVPENVDQFWAHLLKVLFVMAPREVVVGVCGLVVYGISEKSRARKSLSDTLPAGKRFSLRGRDSNDKEKAKRKSTAIKIEIWLRDERMNEAFTLNVLNKLSTVFFYVPNQQQKGGFRKS